MGRRSTLLLCRVTGETHRQQLTGPAASTSSAGGRSLADDAGGNLHFESPHFPLCTNVGARRGWLTHHLRGCEALSPDLSPLAGLAGLT
jgi:hypothetical protein